MPKSAAPRRPTRTVRRVRQASDLLLRLISRITGWLERFVARWFPARKKTAPIADYRRIHFESLEPRLLMSADLMPAAASATSTLYGPQQATTAERSLLDTGTTTNGGHAKLLAVSAAASGTASVTDADGTLITASLTGPGSLELIAQGAGYALSLGGTDATSILNLSAVGGDGRAELVAIDSPDALGSAQLGAADLSGSATFASVKTLVLGDIAGASITNGIAGSASFSAGHVADLRLSAPAANLSVNVTDWTSSVPGALPASSVLSAASLPSLTVAGDFVADLRLSGAGIASTGNVLGTADIGGRIGAGQWFVTGRSNSLSAGSIDGAWRAQFTDTVTLLLSRGDLGGFVAVGGTLSILQASGSLRGATILVGSNLGSDSALGGSGAAADQFKPGTLGRVRIGGDLVDSRITVGLDPVNGILFDGNDQLLGTGINKVQEFRVGGQILGASLVIAPAFPAQVFIGGNAVAPATVTQLSTTAKDITVPQLSARLVNDSGASASDGITKDARIAATAVDAGGVASLRARIGSGAFQSVAYTVQGDGSFLIGTAALASLNGGSLPDGSYSVQLQAVDVAGNVSNTVALAFTLDTAAPTGTIGLAPGSDTGTAGDNVTTAETVTLQGSTAPGIKVDLTAPAGAAASTTAAADGSFSFAGLALALGDNDFAFTLTDLAGNTAALSLRVKRENPTVADTQAPTVSAALVADTGSSASDGITNNPAITGQATDNVGVTQLLVALDPGNGQTQTFTDLTGLLGANGSFALSKATLDALAGGTLADGAHTVRILARDAAGNQSAADNVVFTLDTQAPTGASLGISAVDALNGDNSQSSASIVSLRGTAEAGATITLAAQGLSTKAGSTGAFQLPGVALASGANAIVLSVSDSAGNSQTVTRTLTRVAAVQSDAVLDWVQVALNAIRADVTHPHVATRVLAIQSIAVYDTLAAIQGTPAYLVQRSTSGATDAQAAAAQAAYRVLYQLYPGQRASFDAALATSLAKVADGAAKTAGIALGDSIAQAVLAIRASDGYLDFVTDDGGTAAGQWRATGPMYLTSEDPQWGQVTPFALDSGSQFRAPPPPALDSQEYADAINQVQSLGSATSTTRTADQTQQAQFWADGQGSYTPPGHWEQIAAQVAVTQGNSLSANARLMAQLNVALADAAIAAWDTKYTYDFWRPVTAIQNADQDGNAATIQDPNWTPLLITPAHPSYVSGHSTFSAAAAGILDATFGVNTSFSTTSSTLPGVTRSFTSFDQAADEAGMSRIYGGIHTILDNDQGKLIGAKVAQAVLAKFALKEDLQPPVIVIDGSAPVLATNPTFTGQVLDNLSGVASALFSIDGGDFQSLALDTSGRFSISTAFATDGSADGRHQLAVVASDAAGNLSNAATRPFVLDTRAPIITLDTLPDGTTLDATSRLSGGADATGSALTRLTFQVDAGTVRNLAFDAGTGAFDAALPYGNLAVGSHTLTLSALDAAGHEATLVRSLRVDTLAAFTITSLTPDDGSGDVGVTVRPQIRFSRAVNLATLNSESFFATAPDGTALPATVVPSNDGTYAWLFFASPMPGGSRVTVHVDGSKIRAAADGGFLDANADGSPGGTFATTFTTVSTTSVAGTRLVGKVVDPGPDLKPMTFDDIRRGPDGVIHTPDDVFLLPIAHAKVYILGQEDRFVYTDASGNFRLDGVPVGTVKVAVDGRTATNAPAGVFFPEMVMDAEMSAGVTNTLMGSMGALAERQANIDRQEVYLPRVQTSALQAVSDSATTVVTVTNALSAPQLTEEQRSALTLTVNPGTALGSDGQVLSNVRIGVSTVPPELVKDMLPPGVLQHSFDITIQAPGVTTFAEPVQITFPNVFKAAPATKLNILSFDHTTGRLVINGTGTVSADGLTVMSDPDSGIRAPGWHSMAPPGSEQEVDVGDGAAPAAPGDPATPVDGDLNGDGIPDIDQPPTDPPADKDYRVGLTIDFTIPKEAYYATPFFQVKLPLRDEPFRVDEKFAWPAADITAHWNVGSIDFSLPSLVKYWLPDHKEVTIFNLDANVAATAAVGANLRFRIGSELSSIGVTGTLGATLDAKVTASITGGLVSWLPQKAQDWLKGPFTYAAPTVTLAGIKVPPVSLPVPFGIPDSFKGFDFSAFAQAGVDVGAGIRITPKIVLDKLGGTNKLLGFSFSLTNNTPSAVAAAALESLAAPADTANISASRGFGTDRRAYYRYELADGSEISGVSDKNGRFKVFLPSNTDYSLAVYRPSTNAWFVESGTTSGSGRPAAATRTLAHIGGVDSDGDGIPDIGEYVLGTRSDRPDSDLDSITDAAELAQGTDPLGGLSAPIGVLSSVALNGSAQAVATTAAATGGGLTAWVATGTAGLATVDASRTSAPTVLAQLDLLGSNVDVAVDTLRSIAAVAGSDAGLHLVDVGNPAAPRLLQTVSFDSPVTGVAIHDGIAYAIHGTSVSSVDLNTGETLALLDLGKLGGNALTDIAIDGDNLYTLDSSGNLRAMDTLSRSLTADSLLALGVSGGKMFVGGGVAYVGRNDGFNGGFLTVDVRDRSHLALIAGVSGNNLGGNALAANGSGLAVAVGNPGGVFGTNVLDVVNVADPTKTNVFVTRVLLPATPKDVSLANGLAFVADASGGLQIVNYAGFDSKGIPPSVSITADGVDVDATTVGIQVLEGRTVRVVPTVSDDVQVRSLELLVNGQVAARDVAFPWEFIAQAPTIASGSSSLTLQVRATDTGGNVSLSNTVALDVVPDTSPPVATINLEEGARRFLVRSVDIGFDEPIDTTRLATSGISIVRAGPDGQFGTADDVAAPLHLDTRAAGQQLSIILDTILPAGDYRLTIDPSVISDRAGNALSAPIVRNFTIRPASDVRALSGIPDISTAPSANPGQQIGIGVPFDPTTARMQFNVIDASGNVTTRVLAPVRTDAAADRAFFTVPVDAASGNVVVYSLVGATRTDFPDGTFPLQIVPTITDVQVESVAADGSTAQVLIAGTGFVEGGGTEYRFGSRVVLDAGTNTGADVFGRSDPVLGFVANGFVRLTVPLSNAVFGAINIKTAGGTSASYSASIASIGSVALSGTPTDAAQASANAGQSVTLNGSGLTLSSDILLRWTDINGTPQMVRLSPSAVSADGTSATLIVPAYANGAFSLQMFGSAVQPLLQIVPTLSSYDVQDRTVFFGSGFVEGDTTYSLPGASVTDTPAEPNNIDVYYTADFSSQNGSAYLNRSALPTHGLGNATITTAGGTSAPLALNSVRVSVTGTSLGDVAVDAAGKLWVGDQTNPGHLLKIDPASGQVLLTLTLTNDFGLPYAFNYLGLQVLTQAMTLNGVGVPAGSLLVFDGYPNTDRITAVDPATGAVIKSGATLASLALDQNYDLTGATFDPVTNRFFLTANNVPAGGTSIVAVNATTGVQTGVTIAPFNIQSWSGLAIDPTTGHLWLGAINGGATLVEYQIGAGGALTQLRTLNVSAQGLNQNEISGLSFGPDGKLWVASTQGEVFKVDLGRDPAAVPTATLAGLTGSALQGTPASAGVASANVGQVIELTGTNFGAGTRVLFNIRDGGGSTRVVSQVPLAINDAGTRLQVQVPDLATSGDVRVVNQGSRNLGFGSNPDAVYRNVTLNFVAGASTASIRFADGGLEGLGNESWGIDNVLVKRGDALVFADDFENGANAAWSDATVDASDPGTFTRFSGRFSNGVGQTLSLGGLVAGQSYSLSFDLLALDSWDGNNPNGAGPDLIDVSVDGKSLLRETLSNVTEPNSAQTLRASAGIRLQIVPTLSGLSSGRPGEDTQFNLVGSGFMEGASTVTIGGVALVDSATNLTPFDVTGARNDNMTVVAPRTLDGPIRITTEGGFAQLPAASFPAQPASVFTGIVASATAGVPGNPAAASANTGQTITLTGQGFTGSTLVQFQGIDDSGTLSTLTRTGTVGAGGTTLSLSVPALARTGAVTVLGSGASFNLQIVPTLKSVGGTVSAGNTLVLEGTGLTANDLAIAIDGRGVGSFSVRTVVDGTNGVDQQLVTLTVPAGVGAGLISVSTGGGNATLRTGAISITALADQSPADVGDTIAGALNTGLATNQSLKIVSGIGGVLDVDLQRVDLAAGDQLTLNISAAAGYTMVRIFDAAGTQVSAPTQFNPGSANTALRFTAPAGGTYYVGVSGYSNTTYNPNLPNSGNNASYTGAYTLSLERLAAGQGHLGGIAASAASGTPANAGIASANTGQTITLAGSGILASDRVVFTTLDDSGNLSEVTVTPASVDVAGQTLTVVVPVNATTGRVRLERDATGVLLQIVPTLSDVTMTAGGGFVGANLQLSGSGFAEGAMSVQLGGQTIADIDRFFGLDSFSNATRVNLTVPAGAATGPVRVTTVGGTSTTFGIGLSSITATGASGTPADGAVATANAGQTITLNGSGLDATTDVVFQVIDAGGNVGDRIVRATAVNADGTQLQVIVPIDTVSGVVRVVGSVDAIALQIVPTITDVQVESVAADGSTAQVLIAGTGFVEGGGTEYRFGSRVVLDAGTNTGADVFGRSDPVLGFVANGFVRLTVPLSNAVFGAINIKTAGGTSASYSASIASIGSVALSGTPTDAAQASANAGQSVTLNGSGLTLSSDILLRWTDINGTPQMVRLSPSAVSADGTSATLIVPAYANGAFSLQMFGSAVQPLLQIVPTLSSYDVQDRTVFFGSGFVEGDTTYSLPGASVTDTPAEPNNIDVYYTADFSSQNGSAYLNRSALPTHGLGNATITTAGGTSAPLALNSVRVSVTGTSLGDVAVDAAGKLWVGDQTNPGHLLKIDPASGQVLLTLTLTNDFGLPYAFNYLGLQVLTQAMTLNGVGVPAGSLLVFDGYPNTDRITAVDPATGAVIKSGATLASLALDQNYDLTGATFDPVTNRFFLTANNVPAGGTSIVAVNATTGVQTGVTIAPFNIQSWSGLAIDPTTGHLWLGAINGGATLVEYQIGAGGALTQLRTLNVSAQGLNQNEISGLSFGPDGKLWVASTQGEVYVVTV